MHEKTPFQKIEKSPIPDKQGGASFADAYTSYGEFVINFLKRKGLSTEDAEDIAQSSWLKALQKLESFDPEKGHFVTWLMRIAHNTHIDFIRKNSRRTIVPLESDDSSFEVKIRDHSELPDELAAEHELCEWLNNKINNLPVSQKSAVKLNFFQGYTQKEIAEKTHIPLGTIKTRIRLGQMKIKEMLHDEGIATYEDLVSPSIYETGDNVSVSRR